MKKIGNCLEKNYQSGNQVILKLNEHYVELPTRDLAPAQNYWECFKAMKKNQRDVGVIAEMSRSQMVYNTISLL